jgi:bacterioferritin-associated ferredoxin
MIVCLCHGVSSGRIRALIGAGADTPRKIAAACRAGTDCGSCVRTIRAMVDGSEAVPLEAPFVPRATSPYVVAGEHA